MADKEVWIGSLGPGLYDNTDNTTYGDGVSTRGLRVDQGWVESDPTVDNEIATKGYVYDLSGSDLSQLKADIYFHAHVFGGMV